MGNKRLIPALSLGLMLAAVMFIALLVGGSHIPSRDVINALLNPRGAGVFHTLIWDVRLPRIVLGTVVGAALAGCGVVFQAILRNPLAEPYTLGVSGGGALGASLSIVLGIGGLGMVGMCFGGCLISIFTVYTIASKKNFSNTVLILAGVIFSFLFSSLVMLVFSLSSTRDVYAAVIWLMGSLSSADTRLVWLVSILASSALIFLLFFSRDLDLLSLGDERATYLGLDARRSKVFFFILASFVTALCVAVAGVISFVGLIIPHFTRKLVGPSHGGMLPCAMLAGSSFLVTCDTVSQRLLRPVELPVGVITGITGGVFFLLFLLRKDWWGYD
ncbi:MAG: iron ABC transporter permease [Deltaproteobacteria bacterium]|nr:iron ABC transporter permease [Deltaproteobacteria bacterium]